MKGCVKCGKELITVCGGTCIYCHSIYSCKECELNDNY